MKKQLFLSVFGVLMTTSYTTSYAQSIECDVDVTNQYLTNPKFADNSTDGWNYDLDGSKPSCASEGAEFYWSQGFDLYQSVTLPKGSYKLVGIAYYRAGSVDAAWAAHTAGTEAKNVVLYAGNQTTPVMNLFDGNGPAEGNGWVNPGNGQRFPNWMNEGRTYFDLGEYRDNVVQFTVDDDNTVVQMGYRKNEGEFVDYDWFFTDGMELYRTQSTTLEEIIASAPADNMSAAARQGIDEAIEAMKQSLTEETLAQYEQACDVAKSSIKRYADLKKAIEDYAAKFATYNGISDETPVFVEAQGAYAVGTVADADINDLIARMQTELKSLVWKQSAPADMTEGIAGIGETVDGWTITPGASTWHTNTWSHESATDGTNFDTPFCEYWTWCAEGAIDTHLNDATLTYKVEGLKPGIYEVGMRIRIMQEKDNTYSDQTINGMSLFANKSSHAITTGERLTGPSADRGFYDTYSVKALVDEDGNLSFGLRFKDTNASWVIFRNVTLSYWGGDLTAVKEVIAETVEQANSIEGVMGNPDRDRLDTAIKTAVEANKSSEAIEALKELNEATDNALASIEAYAELQKANDELGNTADQYMNTASAEAKEQAADLYDKNIEVITNHVLAGSEIAAILEEVKCAEAALAIPAEVSASDETPVDMSNCVVNGTFDIVGDFHGWTGTGSFGAGGTTAPCAEVYQGDAFDIYQDVYVKMPGTYRVSVNAHNRTGWAEDDYAAMKKADAETLDSSLDIFFYAISGENAVSVPVKHLSAGGRPTNELSTKNAGTMADPCYVADNMAQADNYFHATDAEDNPLNTYRHEAYINVGEDGMIRIGVKRENAAVTGQWAIFDDFEIWYLGTNSSHAQTENPVAVTTIGQQTAPAAIYSVNGARLSQLQRGVNVVRMSDGTVKKIYKK